jgi:hypothetical protein
MPATLLSAIQVVILSARFNIEMANKIIHKKCSWNIHHVNTSTLFEQIQQNKIEGNTKFISKQIILIKLGMTIMPPEATPSLTAYIFKHTVRMFWHKVPNNFQHTEEIIYKALNEKMLKTFHINRNVAKILKSPL